MTEQVKAVTDVLTQAGTALDLDAIASRRKEAVVSRFMLDTNMASAAHPAFRPRYELGSSDDDCGSSAVPG